MAKVIAVRLLRLVFTILAVTILTFLLTKLLPGDPINAILGTSGERDPATVERIRAELHLDDSIPSQYFRWLGNALNGDLGYSYITDQPISDTIMNRAPVSAQLAIMAIGLAVLMAIPVGVLGAYTQSRWPDSLSGRFVQVALSVPNFIVAIFLIYIFAVRLEWLPASNWTRLERNLSNLPASLKTSILPAMALALSQFAIFSRLIRSDMIATLRENYILSAKAKGLSNRFILFRHALRPSSFSLITILGINFGALLGGTVVIEFVFALPGLGSRLLAAIYQRDVLVIQGITVFIAVVYVVVNTLVDLFYTLIDPRIRRS